MSRFKKCICCFMSALMVFSAVFAVTAFAEDNIRDIGDAKNELWNLANTLEKKYIFGYTEPCTEPYHTDTSINNLKSAINKARTEEDSYTTIEQVDEAINLLNECEANLCIDKTELKFMLDYMYDDYYSVGYYDDALYAELKEVYENAQNAYSNGSDRDVNNAYIKMRNEFNRLCATVKFAGDLNKDGKCDVADITMMQKYLAKLTRLNTAQRFAAGIDDSNRKIDNVTEFQKYIVGLTESCTGRGGYFNADYNIKRFSEDYFEYDLDNVYFPSFLEEDNRMYWNDRYYNDIFWWIQD